MEQTLQTIAELLHGRVIGDGTTRIHGVNSLEDVQEGELTFAEDPPRLSKARMTKASAVIVPSDVEDLGGKSGIRVQNPKLAFALLLELFYPEASGRPGIHPTALLGDRVQLGDDVSIQAHVVIGDDVCLGRGTTIESGVHLGEGVTIGQQCFIAPNVVIYRQAHIGDRVRIHGGSVIGGDGFGYVFHDGQYVKVPQVGNVIIEDDVEIGCNVCVDRATVGSTIIKRGTKIDNLVQIAHNDRIGAHVIITGHVGFSGSVTVGDYAVFGGKAGIVDHVTIGDRAQVGAGSVVTKSVAPGQVVWGFLARPIRETKRQMAALHHLALLVKRLGGLLRGVRAMEQRLDRLERPRP